MSGSGDGGSAPRRRSAAERRRDLIEAAALEFARTGLHGTSVERIARRAGVAQPYVFSLFATKLDLFLAAVSYGFDWVCELFVRAAREQEAGGAHPDVLTALGVAYARALSEDRPALMLQLQAYAACDEPAVRELVRVRYARLIGLVQDLSGADGERIDDFFRTGMALNVAAAMGVEGIESGCSWVREILEGEGRTAPRQGTADGGKPQLPPLDGGAEPTNRPSRKARRRPGG